MILIVSIDVLPYKTRYCVNTVHRWRKRVGQGAMALLTFNDLHGNSIFAIENFSIFISGLCQ